MWRHDVVGVGFSTRVKPRSDFIPIHKKHTLTDTIQSEFGTYPQFLSPGTGMNLWAALFGFRLDSLRFDQITSLHSASRNIFYPSDIHSPSSATSLWDEFTTGRESMVNLLLNLPPWPAHSGIDWLFIQDKDDDGDDVDGQQVIKSASKLHYNY